MGAVLYRLAHNLGDRIGDVSATIVSSDPTVEDPVAFAMEKHLEAFLVANFVMTCSW
jgi:hypothetical protein